NRTAKIVAGQNIDPSINSPVDFPERLEAQQMLAGYTGNFGQCLFADSFHLLYREHGQDDIERGIVKRHRTSVSLNELNALVGMPVLLNERRIVLERLIQKWRVLRLPRRRDTAHRKLEPGERDCGKRSGEQQQIDAVAAADLENMARVQLLDDGGIERQSKARRTCGIEQDRLSAPQPWRDF